MLATAWTGAENALRLAGHENLAGKVAIDATKPLAFPGPDQLPGLALGHTDSGGEQFPGGPPDPFFCGNDDEAKATVEDILTSFGWEPTDIGGIEGARLLEPLCILWVTCGARTGTWGQAFKLFRRQLHQPAVDTSAPDWVSR